VEELQELPLLQYLHTLKCNNLVEFKIKHIKLLKIILMEVPFKL